MSKIYRVKEDVLVALANTCREYGGATKKLTFPRDFEFGIEMSYENGKKAEYDAFWDLFQQNGKRGNYMGAFGGIGWTKDTFKPKYPINPNGLIVADYMFYGFNRISTADIDDLFDFTEFNSKIDFSKSKRFIHTFNNARIKNLYVDCSSATEINLAFSADNGGYLENLTLKVTPTTTQFISAFNFQYHMKNLTFTEDSEIAASINFKWSTKFTHDSIVSIINALSSTTTGLSVTISKTAVNKAFETSTGANDGSTSPEWLALVATKTNWTINLV